MIEDYPDYLFEKAEKRQKENEEFYKFYECEYYGTGDGIVVFLMIETNYGDTLDAFKQFIQDPHYICGIKELLEIEFMKKWRSSIPETVRKIVENRNQSGFSWKQEIYLNYF